MPLIPGDPLALVGFGAILATIVVLVTSDWPRAYVLGISTIVLFGLQFVHQAVAPTRLGLAELSLSTAGLKAGAWWSPVTYAFLHAGLFHIFGNLFILLTAGPALEDSVGPNWFLAIYALGGLGAAAAGVGLSVTTGIVTETARMVGASGAIFGVLTAYAIRHPREKLPIILIFLVVWLPAMTVLLIYLVLNVAYIFTDTSIAWYGHFAGFLVGLALASSPLLVSKDEAQGPTWNPEAIAYLATDRRSREALDHLRAIEPGQEAVAHAWLDVLAEEHACPVCGQPVTREKMRLVCEDGHDLARVPDQEKHG